MAGDGENHVADKIEPTAPTKISYFRLVFDQGVVTQQILDYDYPGSGTEDDPYAVTWIPEDPRNAMNFSQVKKWTFTMLVAIATLAVALVSSAYTGGVEEIEMQFGIGSEVATLGVSLFVLGFAVSYLRTSQFQMVADTDYIRLAHCFGLPLVSCLAANCSLPRPTAPSPRSMLAPLAPRTPGL